MATQSQQVLVETRIIVTYRVSSHRVDAHAANK